jgi:hypothetical protein
MFISKLIKIFFYFLSIFAIVEIQEQISTYNNNIEYVNITHPIETRCYFIDNSKHIS